ncbi:PB1 domain containing protein [Acanthamoeba castellanii str. Neff]|uniref:PB1 domain containing protein n=1 Tax=Acanthamoeba castellanii (strain ATCC 30010 / Neff) TaxID=1257118 RepID=L8H883_ACACF|nr:PB1 domain containing protein [Acanthamoeba castellanii str. Neff]ELR20943.1 PB1 domain containing protein [Acanthamoeba castellanii str. Neff]
MNHQQQQSASLCVKMTIVATNENRFIALPSPPAFALLVEKISTVFDQVNKAAVRIHYVDDESDRVAVSSSDELACALSLLPAGRQLRLFVSTTSTEAGPAAPQQVPTQELSDQVPAERPAIGAASDVDDQPKAIHDEVEDNIGTDGEGQLIDVLKRKLSQEADIVVGVNVCEKQCLRVLARFGGDLDKTVAALAGFHERKQQRHAAANHNKTNNDHHQQQKKRPIPPSSRPSTSSARHAGPRGSRQDSPARSRRSSARTATTTASPPRRGLTRRASRLWWPSWPTWDWPCIGALRRADGDVDAAKADLVDWCAKRQERQRNNDNKTTTAPIQGQETVEGDDTDKKKLLTQLDQMGFGAPTGNTTRRPRGSRGATSAC